MHTSLFYYVQILFLAHILANICSNLIFELPSLPCISHILGLLDLKYVLHITEDEFRIALPHRQMWHRSSVSLLSYSVHILLSTTEPCLRDCQRTCRLGRDSPLPPQQSVCALICWPIGPSYASWVISKMNSGCSKRHTMLPSKSRKICFSTIGSSIKSWTFISKARDSHWRTRTLFQTIFLSNPVFLFHWVMSHSRLHHVTGTSSSRVSYCFRYLLFYFFQRSGATRLQIARRLSMWLLNHE